ncbi:MAG: ATP-binding protein [Gammaproteobacteria bacterium]|nr:ATP-binding protein [Gammaproteobacteria bacterium]
MQTLQTQSQSNGESDLQAAFRLFSQMSGQLETSYRQLELKVEQLSRELAVVNSEKLEQLAEKEKLADRLAALHEAMPAAVIWVDQSKKILSANQTAETIFKKNIVGKNWQSLLDQKDYSFNGHEFNTGDSNVYNYSQCVLDADQGQVIILTNVTLDRELQQSSHQQLRLAELGEITAGLAHQLRTPLASALLSVDHLLHPSINIELHNKSVNRIKDNLLHLDHLVNDMLLYARDGKFESNEVSVKNLLEETCVHFRQKNYENFNIKDISCVTAAKKDVYVSGSKDALLSVLISLAENAYQLATELLPVTVVMDYKLQNQQLVITVSDTGPGLSQSDCEHVFKPFFSTKKAGTGLGLAISRSIICAHNGTIKAVSEQGKGTQMQIKLNRYQSDKILNSNANRKSQNRNNSPVKVV